MKSNVTRKAVCAAALMLTLSVAAESAGAWTRHHHPIRSRVHTTRLARGAPTQIPVLDSECTRSSVLTQFAMQQVGAPLAQTVSTGMGIRVAVLDGGFDLTHEFLQGHLAGNDWDALNDDFDAQDLGDFIDNDNDGNTDWIVGHGTFVSSLILSVAPDAQILPIRVLDDEGWGTEVSVAAGVYYAMGQGCKVINLSLVVPDSSYTLRFALRLAANAGITVVGAAGNDADMWYDDPNLASRVLAVGAVNAVDNLTPWSVTGPTVDCYAPGEMVIGALGGVISNSYARWSGTSFSTPIVSGGAALLMSREPNLLPQNVVNRILSTVDPAIGVTPPDRGRVNLGRALTQQ